MSYDAEALEWLLARAERHVLHVKVTQSSQQSNQEGHQQHPHHSRRHSDGSQQQQQEKDQPHHTEQQRPSRQIHKQRRGRQQTQHGNQGQQKSQSLGRVKQPNLQKPLEQKQPEQPKVNEQPHQLPQPTQSQNQTLDRKKQKHQKDKHSKEDQQKQQNQQEEEQQRGGTLRRLLNRITKPKGKKQKQDEKQNQKRTEQDQQKQLPKSAVKHADPVKQGQYSQHKLRQPNYSSVDIPPKNHTVQKHPVEEQCHQLDKENQKPLLLEPCSKSEKIPERTKKLKRRKEIPTDELERRPQEPPQQSPPPIFHKQPQEKQIEKKAQQPSCSEKHRDVTMTVKHLDSPNAVSKFGAFIRLYTYPCTDTAVIDLFNACERGDLGQVTALVTNGVDVNARVFRYARKPIHVATEKGHAHIVKFLLAQGADKDVRNFDDSSALILAAQNGSADIIRALIEADANVKFTNKFKDTALHIVCNTGRLQPIIERLVENGADLNQSDTRDLPIHIVSRRGYTNSVEWMLNHGCEVDSKNKSGRTPLHAACARGQAPAVDILVERGADVTLRTEDDDVTPFMLGCQYGNAKVVGTLLKTGRVDAHQKDKKGENALYIAYKSKNKELVELLYKEYSVEVEGEFSPIHIAFMLQEEDSMGAFLEEDFKTKDYDEKTALHIAAQKGNLNMVRHCLAMDADANALDKDSNSALYISLKDDKMEVATELLARDDVILDARNKGNDTALDIVSGNGNMDFLEIILDKLKTKYEEVIPNELFVSALQQACNSGQLPVLRTLLRAGARIEPDQELELILSAAENGHTDIIKVLSLNGLQVNIKDDGCNTPIHKACYCSDEQFLKSLIEHDVDINAKNEDGKTVLHLATAHGQAQSVTALVKLGADVNITDNEGRTALHIACQNGRQQVFTVLMQHDASVSSTDEQGAQPLHYAAESGNLTIIRTIIRSGGDVHSRDAKQRTPLHYCCLKGYIYAACSFIEHGADINAQDDHGRTVLHVICERLFESPYVRRYVKFTDVPCDRTYVELTEILLQAGCDASIRDKDNCLAISVILRRLSGLPESTGSSSRILFADEVSNALFALLLDAYYPQEDLNSEMLAKLFSRVGKPVMLLLMRAGCVSETDPHSVLLKKLAKNNDLGSLEELHELGYHLSASAIRDATQGLDNANEITEAVLDMKKGVLRLKELCRLQIRGIFRQRQGRMTAMAERLPIPLQLKDYVVMHHLIC